MTATAPRVVLLTTGGDYGVLVLRELERRDVPVQAVLVQSDGELAECFHRTGAWRRALELPLAVARMLRRRRHAARRARTFRGPGRRVLVTGVRNGARMRRDLVALAPDILVLGGVGVLDATLLEIPRWGTLNGHPGLLPWVRGNGVVAHALLRGVPVGASCHWVDAEIDRGPVVERRLLPVPMGASLASLESEAIRLGAAVLAEMVAACVAAGVPLPGRVQAARHPLCRWATPAERRAAEAAVADGVAMALFERWAARCRPPSAPWRLPDADGPPPD